MPNNETFIISNLKVYAENQTYRNGYVKVMNGQIAEVGSMHELAKEEGGMITLSSEYSLVPGMIDVHIHGASGSDIMDATEEALETIVTTLPKEGTTSFLATTMTQTRSAIEQALTNVAEFMEKRQESGKAEIVGIHLEGPFISPKRAGAQPLDHIIEPNISLFQKWQDIANGHIRLVTLAPEERNGLGLIAYLNKTEVTASIGHSNATYQEVDEAIQAGASHVTHLFNGMRGLHHREPGVLGAALLRQELFTEVIVDGIHSSPEMIQLAYQNKTRERMIVITDSLRAKCLNNGSYDLGGQEVQVDGKKATLADGTLAGSILKMNEAAKNMISYTGCSIEDMMEMTAVNPAKQLRIFDRKGSISVGKDADLLVIDENYDIVMTFCRGKLAYQREDNSGDY